MKYECIADIYSANRKIREKFTTTVNNISQAEASALLDGEKWTIGQIVEHISLVGVGISRICAKLLAASKADNKPSDGRFSLSTDFSKRGVEIAGLKVEAPERVHPTGKMLIPDALENLVASSEALDSLRNDMEQLDLSGHKFPHPFFGELTAGEWLVIAGLHEGRHINQIETLLAKVRETAS